MDTETKLVPTFLVGKRNALDAWHFMQDLKSRLANRVQLTTDGFRPYLPAVEDAFGADVDDAILIKTYQDPQDADKRYSPGEIVHALPIPLTGNPKVHMISTSLRRFKTQPLALSYDWTKNRGQVRALTATA